jgi:hypothetical protein
MYCIFLHEYLNDARRSDLGKQAGLFLVGATVGPELRNEITILLKYTLFHGAMAVLKSFASFFQNLNFESVNANEQMECST